MQTHGLITITAPAKINLCLDILERDEFSGYHKIQTIIHEIPELFNALSIKSFPGQTPQASRPASSGDSAPTHLTKKTLEILRTKIPKNSPQPAPVEIQLTIQNIPDSSGLGGDSSNAAAILKALNKLWQLNLSTATLVEIAAEISMDTPFFIQGGTALATNFGEKIVQLPPLKNIKFSLNPKGNPSSKTSKTTDAYSSLDLSLCGHSKAKTTLALEAIKNNDPKNLLENLHNDFAQLYQKLKPTEHLSGSGPSTFSVTPISGQSHASQF